jgi:hypothetical protein
VREGDDPVEPELDERSPRVLRPAAGARRAVVRQPRLPEPGPAAQPAQEARPLRQRDQHVDHAPVEQAEVAGVERDVDLRRAPQQPVEERVRAAQQQPLLPVPPHAVDDVEAGAPAGEHLRQELGRVLQVAVEQRDDLAARLLEAGRQRHLVAEVAREDEHDHARVALRPVAQELAGAVARSVVDGDDLDVGVEGGGAPRDPFRERRHDRLLVEERDDDREERTRRARVGAAGTVSRPGAGRARTRP